MNEYITPEKRLSRLREKHFTQVLEDAWRAARLKHLMSLLPDDWWTEIRDGIIAPMLADAVTALEHSGFSAEQNQKNGGSGRRLSVAPSGDPLKGSHLTFTFVSDTIRVSSSEEKVDILNELMDGREYVTTEAIMTKVDRFIEAIAVKYPEPEFTGGGIG